MGGAATTPVDPGTGRVVRDGFVVLHDPTGVLGALVTAQHLVPLYERNGYRRSRDGLFARVLRWRPGQSTRRAR